MLELTHNKLIFAFPEVHPDAVLEVILHRTFRIPDDGKKYPLPPSLGPFPVRHVDDFKDKVPQKWVGRGGVMVPLYQSEAMWLGFTPRLSHVHGAHYPFAIKVATGKVSSVTGKKWSKKLRDGDYMVAPEQKWLDGYVVEDGTIRQFVAAPLGLGVTVEEQVTGKAEFGGIQIEVVPMDPERFAKRFPKLPSPSPSRGIMRGVPCSTHGKFGYAPPGVYTQTLTKSKPIADGAQNYSCNEIQVLTEAEARAKRPEMYKNLESNTSGRLECDMSRGVETEISEESFSAELSEVNLDMGLAAGGQMVQQVLKDPYGIADWSTTVKSRCYVHMCNSVGWQHLTGQTPPHPPLTAAQYESRGYRWFHYYEDGAASHSGTTTLKGVQSVAAFQKDKKIPILPENQSTTAKNIVVIKGQQGKVRDGVWK